MTSGSIGIAALTVVAAAALCAIIIALLLPMLKRHALARPNRRSSHSEPTPQGGGIAVIAATIVVAGTLLYATSGGLAAQLAVVFAAAIVLAIVGAVDDILTLEAIPRLLLQAICVAIVVTALPAELRVLPVVPAWLERALIFVAGIWFVNLVNFMDGIDLITVSEVVPLAAGIAFFGFAGALPNDAAIVALGLCGAMIGFAPFNRPAAKLFLGDVGSLPIGLLLGWLLVQLAGSHLTAALLLPLYYVADTTITLFRRLLRGEKIMQAHRSHFYQQAKDGGLTAYEIVARIVLTNLALVALAATTIFNPSRLAHAVALAAGCFAVGLLLYTFSATKARS